MVISALAYLYKNLTYESALCEVGSWAFLTGNGFWMLKLFFYFLVIQFVDDLEMAGKVERGKVLVTDLAAKPTHFDVKRWRDLRVSNPDRLV